MQDRIETYYDDLTLKQNTEMDKTNGWSCYTDIAYDIYKSIAEARISNDYKTHQPDQSQIRLVSQAVEYMNKKLMPYAKIFIQKSLEFPITPSYNDYAEE